MILTGSCQATIFHGVTPPPDDDETPGAKRYAAENGYVTTSLPLEIREALRDLQTEMVRHGLDPAIVDDDAAARADRYERPLAAGHCAGYAIETMLAAYRAKRAPVTPPPKPKRTKG